MADEGSPLLRLAPPRTLTRKKRPAAFPPPPTRKPAEHGRTLGRLLADVRRHFDDAVSRLPSLATDLPYVRIEVAPGTIVTDAELLSVGLVPVYRREDAIVAAYAKERDLRTFQSQLASYAQLKKKLAVLAKIQAINAWTRGDRSGARLKAATIDGKREYTVDLLVMPVVDETPNPQAVRSMEQFVTANAGRVVDRARDDLLRQRIPKSWSSRSHERA